MDTKIDFLYDSGGCQGYEAVRRGNGRPFDYPE